MCFGTGLELLCVKLLAINQTVSEEDCQLKLTARGLHPLLAPKRA
jgi:hypothetical protein